VDGYVECDNCLDEFEPKPYETRVKGGAWQRFNCPHCRHVYDVAFTTTAGLKLRAALKAARRDPARAATIRERLAAEVLRP
jgi:transposase-like protein